jgi:hypothetical protein
MNFPTLPPMPPKDMAALLRDVIKGSEGKITSGDAMTLSYIATQLEAMTCQHTNTDLYHFNATRSSGSCNDCGADVRSGS